MGTQVYKAFMGLALRTIGVRAGCVEEILRNESRRDATGGCQKGIHVHYLCVRITSVCVCAAVHGCVCILSCLHVP